MDYADEFYMELMAETFAGWHAWNRRWGEELYHEVGFLVLSREEMSPRSFERICFDALGRRGYGVERLDAGAIRRRFPAWSSAHCDGYFNPRAGWVESGRVVDRLVREARDAGVEVLAGVSVTGIAEGDTAIQGLRTSGGELLHADAVLIAAGSWTPLLVPSLRHLLWSTAQTVLHFRVADVAAFQPPRFTVWAAALGSEGWYGFPALDDGTVKVANHGDGRRTHPDAERAMGAGDEAQFRAFLRDALPDLAEAPLVGSRVCLYSDSADGDFLIDHDPERPGLVVAAGGSGHGFKFAPSLGGVIADVVERRPNRFAERFRWRNAQPGASLRK